MLTVCGYRMHACNLHLWMYESRNSNIGTYHVRLEAVAVCSMLNFRYYNLLFYNFELTLLQFTLELIVILILLIAFDRAYSTHMRRSLIYIYL